METKKAVIFDWGGVLIDDPSPGLVEYCSQVLGASAQDYLQAYNKFGSDFHKGEIIEDGFWSKMCGQLHVATPENNSLWGEAFKAVYSPKEDVFSLARTLGDNDYKIALLSNTEVPAMRFFYEQKYDMFDALVFSCAQGCAKPQRRIYELAVERLGCQAAQVVFIDDKSEYTEAAKEAGLEAIVFESCGQIKTQLSQLGVRGDS